MSEVSNSPLLRCLAQLNDDLWTEILLPKLLADGSAPAAALTCSRLRQLCQTSRQQLKLTSLYRADTATVRRWTQQLPQRFPACSSVAMKLCQQSYPTAPIIVGVLSRMPALSSLTLEVTLGQQQLALAVVISCISDRLPSLRDLALACADSWDAAGVQQVWEQLGSLTQMTSLKVTFDRGIVYPGDPPKGCLLPHLAPLSNLTGLQQLCINSCKRPQQEGQRQGQGQQGGGFEFLGGLTALTHFDMPVPCKNHGFASISSCTALQVLRLRPVPLSRNKIRLRDPDWDAVGQLARLTELEICSSYQPYLPEAQQPFYAALQKLTQLQTVSGCKWTYAALPVLAGLPELRHVSGNWLSYGDAAGARCEQVTRLQTWGHVELSAFPNLVAVCYMHGVSAETWLTMTASCPKLRDVWVSPDSHMGLPVISQAFTKFNSQCTLTSLVPADRLSALRSLSQLTALTRLSFKSDQPLEVAALAGAVPHVRELHIVALPGVDCTCLTPLAKLAGQALKSLYLYFAKCPACVEEARVEEARVLLSAMSRVPKVVVAVEYAHAVGCALHIPLEPEIETVGWQLCWLLDSFVTDDDMWSHVFRAVLFNFQLCTVGEGRWCIMPQHRRRIGEGEGCMFAPMV